MSGITPFGAFRLQAFSLRQQTLLLLLAVIIPTVLLQVVLVPDLLLRHFVALEHRQLAFTGTAVQHDYAREEARLQAFTENFASWTETYGFAEGHNPTYLNSALVPSTFVGGHVTVWGVTNRTGRLLSAATYSSDGIKVDTAAQQLVRTLLRTLPDDPSRSVSGVANVGEAFYLLAARPITRDDGSGLAGRFTFARLLTPATLQEITSLDPASRLMLTRPSAGSFPDQRTQTTLHLPLNAPNGTVSAVLQVTQRRPILIAGQQAVGQLRMLTVLSAATVLLLGMALIRSRVLRVVERYDAGIRQMQADPTYRLKIHAQDELGRLATTVNDLTERHYQHYLEIQALHQHDSLTGLLNRTGLIRTTAQDRFTSAIMLQVRNLDSLSALYGTGWVDRLVIDLATRLYEEAPDTVCARIRFDTFALLSRQPLVRFAPLCAAAARPYLMNTGEVQLTIIIGQVEMEASMSAEQLLSCSELALQEARDAGELHRTYTQGTRQRLDRRRQLEDGLRTMTEATFTLHYQPVVDIHEQVPVSYEALLRWQHPTLGPVPPAEFIPLAERGGYIYALGQWVLRQAMSDLLRAHRPGLKINVNVSPLQLLNPAFADDTLTLVRAAGLPTACLVLEVTESAVLENLELATAHLTALRAAGVQIALDDFGAGYSSLSLLARLPIDMIKLDRAFLATALTEHAARTILAQIVALGTRLELPVVAEGIENLDMLRLLRELQVRLGQGYLFGRPAPFSASLGRSRNDA
ncbi:bifunctional diguanylate cyclase/phosphodiesterase [Deinococcus ruber]|uniref:EAL domain-containing protein n=1 Tax=Deinococcus ruber TaxID=1848197 RepID=A0A918FFH0_9DEIO|nr:EAL domain-containing protein [Deinococcus ruber]GGR34767.1 hypothetical protein GCM10008957_51070 [Deinococcus ruber]